MCCMLRHNNLKLCRRGAVSYELRAINLRLVASGSQLVTHNLINNKLSYLSHMRLQKHLLLFKCCFICIISFCCFFGVAQSQPPKFKVIAFFTGREDQAHISFVGEANKWFPKMAAQYQFSYDTTTNWRNLNTTFLSQYQVVLFLDTRPEAPEQREAFQKYMESGGAWMGFHFSAFALTPSDFPQNWNWYHDTFVGAGSYVSNTWRPTSAILRVEEIRRAHV